MLNNFSNGTFYSLTLANAAACDETWSACPAGHADEFGSKKFCPACAV